MVIWKNTAEQLNTVNISDIVHSRHKRPSKCKFIEQKAKVNEGQEGKRKECPISHNFQEKGGKRKEPVTSVTILMQPMAVVYMKLDNHAGSKGCPLLIYRTSREPVPSAWDSLCSPTPTSRIQGLLGALPPDPWLHPNISVGCATSQYQCWLCYIPVFVLAVLYPSISVGCATPQY